MTSPAARLVCRACITATRAALAPVRDFLRVPAIDATTEESKQRTRAARDAALDRLHRDHGVGLLGRAAACGALAAIDAALVQLACALDPTCFPPVAATTGTATEMPTMERAS